MDIVSNVSDMRIPVKDRSRLRNRAAIQPPKNIRHARVRAWEKATTPMTTMDEKSPDAQIMKIDEPMPGRRIKATTINVVMSNMPRRKCPGDQRTSSG